MCYMDDVIIPAGIKPIMVKSIYTNSPCFLETKLAQWILAGEV